MLTEADIRILDVLQSPRSIKELSGMTGYSSGYVSERVTRLENLDLIQITHRDRTKKVQAIPTPLLETYRDLTTSHTTVDYASLISPSMLHVCWFLEEPLSVGEIEARLTLKRRRIYQLLEELQSRGFITKDGNQYVLTERQRDLARFAKVVIEYEQQRRAQSHNPKARAIWTAPHEALIAVRDETAETARGAFETEEHWFRTGLIRFANYGLDFFTTDPELYFYSELKDTLQPADFISHTLMQEADTRNLSYCALLMMVAGVSRVDLRAAASYYGIEETIDALVTFVETEESTQVESVDLPSWDEVESLATQYGVSV